MRAGAFSLARRTRARFLLLGLAIAAVWIHIGLALGVAPTAAHFNAPETQRVLYYHVPAAWVAYLAFAVTFGGGLYVLARGNDSAHAHRVAAADRWAHASAEVGVVFALVALVTGLVWARVEFFNYEPVEDPKVVTLVALIVAYLAYLALRAGIAERGKRERVSAVFGVASFLGVPVSYLASRIASPHPDWAREDSGLHPTMLAVLLASLAVFTLLYVVLALLRTDLLRAERALEDAP